MSNFMRGVYILATATLLLAILLSWPPSLSPRKNLPVSDDKVQEVFWAERVASLGAVDAHEEFAQSIASLPSQEQHIKAHTFGGALYEESGVGGLPVCDARFDYGCFHELIGRMISDKGLSAVAEVNRECLMGRGPNTSVALCQHGIGHGILGNIGYEEKDLSNALAICRDMEEAHLVTGCYGGVFMEYTFRTMLGSGVSSRTLEDADIYAPCNRVAAEYQGACMYSQTMWWQKTVLFGEATSTIFARMGEYCRAAGMGAAVRRHCFVGIGDRAQSAADLDPSRTVELCDIATQDENDRFLCVFLGVQRIAKVRGSDAVLQMCEGFTSDMREYCTTHITDKSPLTELPVFPSQFPKGDIPLL